jgi:hypothetical protein
MHGAPTSDGENMLIFALPHLALAPLTNYTPLFGELLIDVSQLEKLVAGVQYADEGHSLERDLLVHHSFF